MTCLFVININAQAISSSEILKKSIQYHDPNSEWKTLKAKLYFTETRPDGEDRKSNIAIDNQKGLVKINRSGDVYGMLLDSCFIEAGDVECSQAEKMRNYYLYLWGLPMKLLDAGTPIEQEVTEENYENIPCYVLKVSYEKDTWFFFISKSNYKMEAYKFMFNDKPGKGEFIKLKGESNLGNMKIPSERSWNTIPENKYLGTDILTSSEALNK